MQLDRDTANSIMFCTDQTFGSWCLEIGMCSVEDYRKGKVSGCCVSIVTKNWKYFVYIKNFFHEIPCKERPFNL